MTIVAEKTVFRCGLGWPCLCLLVLLQMCTSCTDQGPDHAPIADQPPATTLDGVTVPLFDTAPEQLNYAKSLFASTQVKSAALNVLIDRFPDDRQQKGEARLELAYLYLGDDFRLADEEACTRALAAYESIAQEFIDLPAVRAKANWYMAWIYTDLLGDKKKGLALYTLLAEKYPKDSFSRISPVPWLKLVFPHPEMKPYTADDEHTHSWAGLARLEIVRNAELTEERMHAFNQLWKEHRHSLTTGYALKEMLRHPPPFHHMAQIVDEYIQGNVFNEELNQDLLLGLARWSSTDTTR